MKKSLGMKKMIKAILVISVVALVGVMSASADVLDEVKARGELIVGSKADYMPFGFRDTSGAIVGFEPDMAADIARRIGVKVKFIAVTSANRMEVHAVGHVVRTP